MHAGFSRFSVMISAGISGNLRSIKNHLVARSTALAFTLKWIRIGTVTASEGLPETSCTFTTLQDANRERRRCGRAERKSPPV